MYSATWRLSPIESTNDEAANGVTAFGLGPPFPDGSGDWLGVGLGVGLIVGGLEETGLTVDEGVGFGETALAVAEGVGFGGAGLPEKVGVADVVDDADGVLDGAAAFASEDATGDGESSGAGRTPSTLAGKGATSAVLEQAVRRMTAQIATRDTLFMIERIARQLNQLKRSDRIVSELTAHLPGRGATM